MKKNSGPRFVLVLLINIKTRDEHEVVVTKFFVVIVEGCGILLEHEAYSVTYARVFDTDSSRLPCGCVCHP